MISTARRARFRALPLVLPVVLSLVACQRAGTMQRADGWERPEPFAAAGAVGERLGGGHGTDASSPDRSTTSTPTPAAASTAIPSGSRPAEHALDNTTAADLLDHWGHRRVQGLVEGLSLRSPGPQAHAADLAALRAAASATGGPHPGNEVRILGARRGVTWGRWTGGPADTLSITFDLSAAGPAMRDYPGFRAMAERAGKAWSHRIADTWPAWHRPEGDFKGWLIDGSDSSTPVHVGVGGEVSTDLVIDLRDDDLAGDHAGWAQAGHGHPGGSWQPRFAPLEIDREYLWDSRRESGESELFAVLVHEIGHTLGAWQGGSETQDYAPFTDTGAGTWTGPNVVAVHGEAAPFQDASDPHAWVDGERSPLATLFDVAHSGVCDSIMAYCRDNAPRPAFVPHDIDFAFLADLGMTVLEGTDEPETYGLAGWTEHAGFTLAVSRDLRIDLVDARSDRGRTSRDWRALDVTDLFQVEADAFGHGSIGSLSRSYPATDPLGSVRFSGGLIGAAIDRAWMPPVTGDAALAVELATLDGTASFTSLAVHTGGVSETFAGGALHYPFALEGNAIVGTDASSILLADFYGPWHEDVAGTLHDPDAGLLASFGATYDDAEDGAAADQESGPAPPGAGAVTGMRALTVRREGIRHVGAAGAAPAGALAWAGGRNGVAVSFGDVRDGESAERVAEYLAEQTRGDGYRLGRTATGLPTFAEPPTLRLARETSEELAAYAMRAVTVVNAALPADRRIVIGTDPAPPGAVIGNVPDGEIFIDFTPLSDDRDREVVDPRARSVRRATHVDPNAEYDRVAQRWEEGSMRAARVWADGRDLMAALRTAWVWNAATGVWDVEVLDSPVVETGTVQKYFPETFGNALMVRQLLVAMGFLGQPGPERFPDSFLTRSPAYDTWHLPTIDADALLAAYGRLEPGTEPEDLSPESLGPWSDTSFHLRGGLALAGGPAAFGVALRNGLARPWAFGPEPLAALEDNTALYGTVAWNGALAGITPAEETVAGDARLAVELATLEGRLDFTGLERWGERAAPGAPGSGTTWGDGDLGYSIRVEGNAIEQTGGDEGDVTGAFFGPAHEAMGGVLRRDDLSAGFGGTR